jgi:hypothetical protein
VCVFIFNFCKSYTSHDTCIVFINVCIISHPLLFTLPFSTHWQEIPREKANELQHVYARAKLVLRPYFHFHEADFMQMMQDLSPKLVIIPVGYGAGVNVGYPSGVSMAYSFIHHHHEKDNTVRDLKWSFAGRLGVHESRRAMSNVFSPNWSPHERHVDLTGVFAGGPLTPMQVADSYSRALFVPSPPGNSPDCFRHYEATIRGSIPIIEGRPTDYSWWCEYYHHKDKCASAASGTRFGLGPFPAPLGWMFPGDPTALDPDSAEERFKKDMLGFNLDGFTLYRRTEYEMSSKDRLDQLEDSWMDLLKRAKAMGEEELALRRELNARYYIGTMTEIRKRVLQALSSSR